MTDYYDHEFYSQIIRIISRAELTLTLIVLWALL
jgi:hypothetical protein